MQRSIKNVFRAIKATVRQQKILHHKRIYEILNPDREQRNDDQRRNNRIEIGGDQRHQAIDPAVESVKRAHKGDCNQLEIHKNDNHYRGSSPKALRLLGGLK